MKKSLRRIIFFALCLAMIPNTVFAASIDSERIKNLEPQTFNELEYLLEVKELPRQQLKTNGYSDAEIEELKNLSIEDTYLERAELPYETLVSYGYDDEQIEILKNYDGSPITPDSEMMALAAEMRVSKFKPYQASTSGFTVKYNWEWDSVPINRHTDRVIIYWKAYNNSPQEVDTELAINSADITYVDMISGNKRTVEEVSGSYTSIDNIVYVPIDLVKGRANDEYWAKKGTYTVRIEKAGTDKLSYAEFGAAYGHKLISASDDFSFSLEGLALDFHFNTWVDKVTNASCTYKSNGNLTNHGDFKQKGVSELLSAGLFLICVVGSFFVWPLIALLIKDIVTKQNINMSAIVLLTIYTFSIVLLIFFSGGA